MSTRSAIARETENGVDAVYVHWDGYPSYTGRILRDNWDSANIADLLAGGDISVLGPDMAVTVFYHRDKNESLNPADRYSDPADYLQNFRFDVDWYYLLTLNGVWTVSQGRSGPFRHLDVAIAEDAD